MLLEQIKDKIRGQQKRIVLVDTQDARCLDAVNEIIKDDLGKIILVGKKEELEKNMLPFWKGKVTIYDPADKKLLAEFAEEYYQLRKEKGINKTEAERLMQQHIFFGTMLVRKGMADGLIAGLSSATKPFIPAFHIIGVKPGMKKVSSFFIMERKDQAFVFADCALQENPSAEELAEIGIVTAKSAEEFGILSKVAFLSYSTYGSASHPDVQKVQAAVALAQKSLKEVDGELQVDAALVPEIAKKKKTKVQGNANVLVFPNLDAGNIGYKLTERLAGFTATGPILQGLAKPINDLSRGASVEDMVNVFAITAFQALKK